MNVTSFDVSVLINILIILWVFFILEHVIYFMVLCIMFPSVIATCVYDIERVWSRDGDRFNDYLVLLFSSLYSRHHVACINFHAKTKLHYLRIGYRKQQLRNIQNAYLLPKGLQHTVEFTLLFTIAMLTLSQVLHTK
jgi:hypothetical protein